MSEYLIELTRGDDHMQEFLFVDDLDVPVPITGRAYKTTMKQSLALGDEDAPVKVDIPAVSGEDAANGRLVIKYPHEQTKDLMPGIYYVDLQEEYLGNVTTVLSGTVLVHGDVTNRVG